MSALKAVTFHSKSFRVQEVIVMKSQLTRSGAIYTPLEKLRLHST
jgi:2'-5' RNA ligase